MSPNLPRKIVSLSITLLGVATAVFLLIHLVPGDPVDTMLGESAGAADRAQLRSQLGLDRPLLDQYRTYLGRLAHLDLGESLLTGKPVSQDLVAHYPATIELTAGALVVAILLALPLGLFSAARAGGPIDAAARIFSVLATATPGFWLGPLLILVFSIELRWTPVSGRGGLAHLLLPSLTLGLGMAASMSRLLRACVLERLAENYIRTARAKGLSETRVFLAHALRNAALPMTSVVGLHTGALLSGAILTETIFAWPGLGRLLMQAIQSRDYPLVQGCLLFIALSYVGLNLLTDLLYWVIDPRTMKGPEE